jgi:hypothetical protein
MDPIVPLVTKTAEALSEAGKERAKGFISAVFHAPGEALGGLFADAINERRHANLIKIAGRAQERLTKAGVSAKEVPLSVIHPAIQAASLEEDPELQEVWANLLANAADPRAVHPMPPSFPNILKELSSREVKLLDVLFQMTIGSSRGFNDKDLSEAFSNARLARFVWSEGMTYVDMGLRREDRDTDQRNLGMCMDTLRRHELVIENIEMGKNEERGEYRLDYSYNFSYLGTSFVNACRPPMLTEI